MPFSNYGALQNAILDWCARPGDPLVSPAVPDMIQLFEEDARDRLRTRFNENATATLTLPPSSNTCPLPDDFIEMRGMYIIQDSNPNRRLTFQTPDNLDTNFWYCPGNQWAYTIEGQNLRFVGYTNDTTPQVVNIDYMQGLPALSEAVPSNWLLANYPSLYLFGSLCYAGIYVGGDVGQRVQAEWLPLREMLFGRVQLADRKARFSGGPLVIQTDTKNP